MIESSLDKLKKYIEDQDYRGYDPYDALKSPLFKLPLLRSSKLIRFGTQQFVKRFLVNLRPLLFVPKGLNPVTLGLMIQGYGYLTEVYPDQREEFLHEISNIVQKLRSMIPDGYSGDCWGYDFDWEARHAKIPAYQPTIVATGIITNGLFEAYKITGLESLKDLVVDSVPFILEDLNRIYEGKNFCFSYSPFDSQQVMNASMKGVRLLSQAYSVSKKEELKKIAGDAVQFVTDHQNKDGSWFYSLANKGTWIDNYHTGYILDCLKSYIDLGDDRQFEENFRMGYHYYKNHFFADDGQPWFYSNHKYPADCTAASQSILTLARNGDVELAEKVAKWTLQHMQKDNGSFYFRKYKHYTIKTSFMRWSNAWMFAALAYLLCKKKA